MNNFESKNIFAVFSVKGKQYKAFSNDTLLIDKSSLLPGDSFLIKEEIILVGDKESTLIGTPYLKNVNVDCTVLKQVKGAKVISLHKRRRKNSRTYKYTKPLYTLIKVNSINIT